MIVLHADAQWTPRSSLDAAKLLKTNAGMAELADAADSKSAEVHPSWGFDPPSRHHLTLAVPTIYWTFVGEAGTSENSGFRAISGPRTFE